MLKTEDLEKAKTLIKAGWKQVDRPHAWRWYLPKYPNAFHTLDHAYDIQKSIK